MPCVVKKILLSLSQEAANSCVWKPQGPGRQNRGWWTSNN